MDFALALALAKDPDARLSSAATFAAVLSDAARGTLAAPLRNAARELLAAAPWWSPDATVRVGPRTLD